MAGVLFWEAFLTKEMLGIPEGRCHLWRMASATKKTSPIAAAIAWDKTFHKRIRKRFGLSKYQYLTLTFVKGLVVGYLLALLFHR